MPTANSKVLPKDKNNNSIQMGSGYLLNDNSSSIQNSPIPDDETDITLVFPANAIKLYIYLPEAAARLKQGDNYITIPSAQYFSISGQPGDSVVIGRPASTSIEFVFEILQ